MSRKQPSLAPTLTDAWLALIAGDQGALGRLLASLPRADVKPLVAMTVSVRGPR
jgi:hypothetical protein